MNKILDNDAFPVEERLEMAKVFLEMKDSEIQELKAVIDNAKSDRAWALDQASNNRMGL